MAYCDCNHIRPCETKPSPCKVDTCKDCIRVSSPVIMPRDSVGPCGKSGYLNLKPLNNYSICGENASIFHKVVKYDSTIFSNVYIDDTDGKLELRFTTTNAALPYEFYEIYYKAVCIENGKGDFGVVRVGIKDECEFSNCNNCNPCTGDCVEGTTNVSVSIGNPNNISVNIT